MSSVSLPTGPDDVPQLLGAEIRSEVGDVIINYSTGAIGVPIEKRIELRSACLSSAGSP